MKNIIIAFFKNSWAWALSKTTIDEKIIDTAAEVKRRAKNVKQEIKDVGEAIAEVGDQVGDVAGAIKGKSRAGRKKKEDVK